MKFKGLIIVTGLIITLSACSQNGVGNLKLTNGLDSLSYAIGVLNQISADRTGLDLDPMILAKGMVDSKEGKALMNETAANGFIAVYMREMQDQQNLEQFKEVFEQGMAFLEENKNKEGVMTTESGLQYKVITEGNGEKPGLGATVKVLYKGTFIDGTEFDSSLDENAPAEFQIQGVIAGWTEGLQLMPVGSKFMLYVPYQLGYGEQGYQGFIDPYTTLIFEVELLEIVK